jgi:putative MATE family efflux protein
VNAPAAPPPAHDARTHALLEAPITRTLLRMAVPNVLLMFAQAAAGLIETYFIGKLGTDALAGMALVFPAVMLTQMLSAGAIGGGISSAIARALGGRRRDDANALVLHAVAIALAFGLAFTLGAWLGGPWLYAHMGGAGASLDAALLYSNWVFGGAALIWLFNALASALRGTGNMALPAQVSGIGTLLLVPLSALLIFGWGPVPAGGIAGGAIALLLYYALGTLVLIGYLLSRHSLLRPFSAIVAAHDGAVPATRFRAKLFADILRVGLAGAISAIATNVTIAVGTGLVGNFGPAAIAGYGTAARIEYLLVPLVFGFGAPLVAMVGTCIGAGKRERALRAAWTGAAIAAAMTEAIGLLAAIFPRAWLGLFDTDPAMLEAGEQYLRWVGPTYGFFGLALLLYFASQGAGRLFWPIVGNLVRLAVAAAGGWLALRLGAGLGAVFAMQALGLVAYGLINATAVARGAWFAPKR